MTFLMKRVFPVFWFGILALISVSMVISSRNTDDAPIAIMFGVPAAMAIIGFVIMRRLLFDLVDEVWDAGDELVVRNGPTEARIRFSDIAEVHFSSLSNPQRVTLSLRNQTQLGNEIHFLAPTRVLGIGKHPLYEELMRKVGEAHQR